MLAKFSTTFSALTLCSITAASAIDDVPYGIEAVAQYRSEYNYRGFQLADTTQSFQLETRYALNNSSYLKLAAWHDTEVSDGDFTEAAALFGFGKNLSDSLSLDLSATYRSYSNSQLDNGVDLAASSSYLFTDNWSGTLALAYDTGAEGLYAALSGAYYHRINDDSFLNFSAGVSFVEDYYQLSGANDVFAKLSYSYNINSSVSISPYLGCSVLLDNEENRQDSLHGGVYFAVTF